MGRFPNKMNGYVFARKMTEGILIEYRHLKQKDIPCYECIVNMVCDVRVDTCPIFNQAIDKHATTIDVRSF